MKSMQQEKLQVLHQMQKELSLWPATTSPGPGYPKAKQNLSRSGCPAIPILHAPKDIWIY